MPTETTVLHASEETTPTLEQLKSQLEDAKKVLKTAQEHEAEVKANSSSSAKDKKDAHNDVSKAQAKVDELTSKVSTAKAAAVAEEAHGNTEAHEVVTPTTTSTGKDSTETETNSESSVDHKEEGTHEETHGAQPSAGESAALKEKSKEDDNAVNKLGGVAINLACGAYRML